MNSQHCAREIFYIHGMSVSAGLAVCGCQPGTRFLVVLYLRDAVKESSNDLKCQHHFWMVHQTAMQTKLPEKNCKFLLKTTAVIEDGMIPAAGGVGEAGKWYGS